MAFSLIRRLLLFVAAAMIPIAMSQTKAAPPSDSCNGIFLSYAHTGGEKIPPILKSGGSTDDQPYRFESTLTVLNNGREEVKSWRAFVGFQHDEYLVSASGAVLADGTSLPTSVGGGVVFAGYPSTDLKTAIETAGDVTQMQVQVKFVGTQFGVASPSVPMPTNISLVNDGFVCPKPDIMQGKSEMQVCCRKDPKFKSHTTSDDEFLPRQNGDLTIMFDVTRTYDSNYWAKVTISNHNPLGRLDNWKLSWDWMKGEFINSMKGAYPDIVDTTDCIFSEQGQYYQGLDFSNVLNCERRPTIIDLPPTKANDSMLGKIPFCCRNGTILPPSMDPSRSTSAFEMNVYKMPPNLNRSELSPPQNWNITGALNPDYRCGPPVRVSPSEFVDTSGLPSNITVVASWQVVCNITQPPKGASPKCCVSFSAYYDESVVPCRTCACGCPSTQSRTCSTTAPAVLLPPEALLVPFENRSARTKAWAALKHLTLPNPMPCGDNCGVSINWHLFTDNSRGWTARMTIFNWGETSYADWFAAVQMDNAAPGFQGMYSLKATVLDGVNNTIFMQGPEGFNYLVAETDGDNPQKDVRVPGKQQSVISFTKKHTPGINVPEGAGFPSKVFFNGEECSLPLVLPTSSSFRKNSVMTIPVLLLLIVVLLMSMQQ